MIDASRGFLKEGNKNRLRAQDIHRIVDVFNRQIELPRYSRMVPVAEIAGPANDYNLNIPRYVDSSEPEDLHDLGAHLRGGIPDRDLDALDRYWTVFPSLRQALFEGNGRTGYSAARFDAPQVKATTLRASDFKSYEQRVAAIFDAWRNTHDPLLVGIEANALPRTVIHTVSEDLLARFADLPLLDRYDVYQRLMDYWDAVMQDDVYLIVAAGWAEAAKPRGIIEDKEKKIKETADLTINEERDILMRCLALIEADSEPGKAVKGAQAAMDRAVLARYATLTEAEIKTLVVEDKWYASIRAAIDDEVQRLTQRLTRRVQELEQRYARPLPALEQEVEVFSAKVEGHLKKMGLSL